MLTRTLTLGSDDLCQQHLRREGDEKSAKILRYFNPLYPFKELFCRVAHSETSSTRGLGENPAASEPRGSVQCLSCLPPAEADCLSVKVLEFSAIVATPSSRSWTFAFLQDPEVFQRAEDRAQGPRPGRGSLLDDCLPWSRLPRQAGQH